MAEAPKKHNKLSQEQVAQAAEILKVLGHPIRLRIIEHLDIEGETTVGAIAESLDVSSAQLSTYLKHLKLLNLVKVRKYQTSRYYSLNQSHLKDILQQIRTSF